MDAPLNMHPNFSFLVANQLSSRLSKLLYFATAAIATNLIFSSNVFANDQLKIGLMAELTGQFSRLGEDCQRGFHVARQLNAPGDIVNNRKIKFFLADNQGIAKTGVTEFRRLIDVDKVVSVVTTRSPVGIAINPISKQRKIPIIGVVGHPDFLKQNEFAFRSWPSAAREGKALASKCSELNKKKAATISLEDDYFLSLAEEFSSEFSSLGGEVVSAQTILAGDSDLASIVSILKREKPDVILVNLGPAQAGSLVKKIREQGFTGQIISNFLIGLPDALKAAGDAAEEIIFSEIDFDKKLFLGKLQEKFGSKQTSPIGYSCYVALSTLLNTIRDNPSISTPSDIYKSLESKSSVPMPDGELKIVSREIQLDLVYKKIENGNIEELN